MIKNYFILKEVRKIPNSLHSNSGRSFWTFFSYYVYVFSQRVSKVSSVSSQVDTTLSENLNRAYYKLSFLLRFTLFLSFRVRVVAYKARREIFMLRRRLRDLDFLWILILYQDKKVSITNTKKRITF